MPDPDPQRSLPELSVFYQWMIIPYLTGIYFLFKDRVKRVFKFILLLSVVTIIPAALTKDPFSTQRSLPLLLPLISIITIGIDKLIHKRLFVIWFPVFVPLLIGSLLLLWRSYFILTPKERAKVWAYGFSQLAEQIKTHPNEKFLIDQSERIRAQNPAYIQLVFHLKLPPEELQKGVDQSIKENYYTDPKFDQEYNFANIEIRPIYWEKDIYKEQILVGDEISISTKQVQEHSLTKIFEIRDPIDQIIFQGFKTNPNEKCMKNLNQSIYCKNII